MNDIDPSATPKAQGLAEWRRIAAGRDWDAFAPLLTDEITYHNPASLDPISGRDATVGTFRAVFSVLKHFTYLREYTNDAGVALEFTAKVLGETVFGTDLIDFDNNGKIINFMVMMRPAATVQTLAAETVRRSLAG